MRRMTPIVQPSIDPVRPFPPAKFRFPALLETVGNGVVGTGTGVGATGCGVTGATGATGAAGAFVIN